jgi:hypothetical protein
MIPSIPSHIFGRISRVSEKALQVRSIVAATHWSRILFVLSVRRTERLIFWKKKTRVVVLNMMFL